MDGSGGEEDLKDEVRVVWHFGVANTFLIVIFK